MLTATPVIEPLKFESPLGMMDDNFFARNFFEIGIKLWWLSGPHRSLIREGLVVYIHTFTFCFFFKSNTNSTVWKSICHGKHRDIRIYSPPPRLTFQRTALVAERLMNFWLGDLLTSQIVKPWFHINLAFLLVVVLI